MSRFDSGALPRNPKIRTIPYDQEAVAPLAGVLDTRATLAEFQLPGAKVWQLTVAGTKGRPVMMVTLWPSRHRVDVVCGGATVVFSGIETIDLVPEVEVQFRKANRDTLILARNGQVIVRS